MRILAAFLALTVFAVCALAEESPTKDSAKTEAAASKAQLGEAEKDPRAVVIGWLALLEKEQYGEYVDAALDPAGVPDRAKMITNIKANKEFFLAILKAMKEGTLSVMDDGKNKIAAFTFAKETQGYYAASLTWAKQRWVVFNMYRPGQPIKSFEP